MKDEYKIRGFDFHCHVDLHPDPPDLIRGCEERQIAVLAVTTTPKAWPQNHIWTRGCKFVHAAVGLHPELVGKRFSETPLLEEAIGNTRLVGEVGLDGSPQHGASYSRQKEVFSRSLVAAQKHGGRVVTIHSRRAERDVTDTIRENTDPLRVLCILHWFSGSVAELRRAAELGCYFSINSEMLRNERGRKLVRAIPKDRLLIETDSPFTEVNGRKSIPADSVGTCRQLADHLGNSVDSMRSIISRNATKVFEFAGIQM